MAPFEETAKPTENKQKPVVSQEVLINIGQLLNFKEKNGELSKSPESRY